MSGFGVLCWVITGAAFIDALRRPGSDWVEADRRRAFWVVMIVLLNVFGAAAYALLVLPRMARRKSSVDSAFTKGAGTS